MKYLIFIFLAFIISPYLAAKTFEGPYQAEVIRVLDGDTIEMHVYIWPQIIFKVKVRLLGVNTPEKRGRVTECEKVAGLKATEFTKNFLANVNNITVSNVKLGSFARRVIGSVHGDGVNLGKELIDNDLAVVYFGGKRKPWCDL